MDKRPLVPYWIRVSWEEALALSLNDEHEAYAIIGTELVGYFLKRVQEEGIVFPLAEIAAMINFGDTTDRYIQGLVAEVNRDRAFEPMAKSTSVQSHRLADKTGATGEDNMAVSGMLCVFRLVRWMDKGKDWDAEEARNLWAQYDAENPDARAEDRLAFFQTDLDSELRFTRRPDAGPDEAYLGYSHEDWSRGLCILATIFVSWNRMWEQVTDKRQSDLYLIQYESTGSLKLSLAEEDGARSEKDRQRLAAIKAMANMASATQEADITESLFRSVIDSFVRSNPGQRGQRGKDVDKVDFKQGMEDITRQMKSINDYMGLTHRASAVSDMNKPEKYKPANFPAISAI